MPQPVCAIPGAGPGLGLALAQRFASAGYRVAVLARDADRLAGVAGAVQGAVAYACDVGDADSVAEAFARIETDMGAAQTLLYNAGAAAFGDIDRVGPAEFEAAWRTNALGLFHCAQAVLPAMRRAGTGNIVVTGATASLKGGAKFAAFAASKAAQHSLAQSLARQLGPEGIHVAVAIVDGVIDSERTRRMLPDREDDGFMQAADIADAIHHLTCQPRSAWTFQLDLRPFGERW